MNVVTGGDSNSGYDKGLSWGGNRLKFGERFFSCGLQKHRRALIYQI